MLNVRGDEKRPREGYAPGRVYRKCKLGENRPRCPRRRLTDDVERWFCEFDGSLTAFVNDTDMALVEDGALPGYRQLDMGNVGYNAF